MAARHREARPLTAMELGLLSHDSPNLGDEIQSLAARRFLPRVDRLVPREDLAAAPGGTASVKVILNGWFLHNPHRWPPHERIVPLLVSFHLSGRRPSRLSLRRSPAGVLLAGRNLEWLRRHGPVGARDPHTLALLRRRGVDAYYSSCLTLTLPPADPAARGDRVVASDLSPELLAALARRTRRPPLVVEHIDRETSGAGQRMARAEALLATYAAARAVVTTRLHCALPCLALGTPVLFVRAQRDVERVVPALELAHNASVRDFLAGRDGFDPEDPPANPDRHRPLAAALARRCEAFVGA